MTAVARQFVRITDAAQADFILIHREIIPFGPPIIEWFLAKVFGKKIIYDFDDAIWLTDKVNERWMARKLRWRSKVGTICRWSYKVSAGNEYLCSFARQYAMDVVLNPTTIDTQMVHNSALYKGSFQSESRENAIIGWTGSRTTLKYLEGLESVLRRIEEKYPAVSLLVIADKPPQLSLKNLRFLPWSKETEIADLCRIDIGIMPMPNDDWTRGKCGFKALQYMALGIPAVVSPVAVNKTIITPGVNGYWCETEQEWVVCLARLIEDAQLRKAIGANGRAMVEKHYSISSNSENFLSLFR